MGYPSGTPLGEIASLSFMRRLRPYIVLTNDTSVGGQIRVLSSKFKDIRNGKKLDKFLKGFYTKFIKVNFIKLITINWSKTFNK